MEVNYSYKFTEKAEEDLDAALRYIAEELNNPSAASNLAKSVFKSIDAVLVCPDMGKLVVNEYLSDKTIRRLLIDNYVLYYKVLIEEKTIYIVRFVYGKRNLDEITKTL